jgi:hypothetical protein
MSKYSTISVPEEVKQTLEKNKGDKEWGEYLLEYLIINDFFALFKSRNIM